MSLWWTQRGDLDKVQISVIEEPSLRKTSLILGPPGSGKTNVLVRRAQFVRSQGMPNVLVLSFTRSLTEFIKTGCFDSRRREIFPVACVTTIESWIQDLYRKRGVSLPDGTENLPDWKREIANNALGFRESGNMPQYDALFIDEAQDLMAEEIQLLQEWSSVLFFVGDDRQRMYREADGLAAVRTVPSLIERALPFHYRLAPIICRVADRILTPQGGGTLEGTAHYTGPKPGTVEVHGPGSKEDQLEQAAEKLKSQIRVYADLIQEGDRLAVFTARRENRDRVFEYFEQDPDLQGQSQIIRARESCDDPHDPSFDPDTPICIMTIQACKGLEFRAGHWLFCEDLQRYHDNEIYYTVVTRMKTSLDIYYTSKLPQTLAAACEPANEELW